MRYTDKMQSIRASQIYGEMMGWYDNAQRQYAAMPADLERTDKAAWQRISAALDAVEHAFDAVIDAHVAQQVVVAMQELRQNSVPVDALAELDKDEDIRLALGDYQRAWQKLGGDPRAKKPGQGEEEDDACARAEEAVSRAVQEFARKRLAGLVIPIHTAPEE